MAPEIRTVQVTRKKKFGNIYSVLSVTRVNLFSMGGIICFLKGKLCRRYPKLCRLYPKLCRRYPKLCRRYRKLCRRYPKLCRRYTKFSHDYGHRSKLLKFIRYAVLCDKINENYVVCKKPCPFYQAPEQCRCNAQQPVSAVTCHAIPHRIQGTQGHQKKKEKDISCKVLTFPEPTKVPRKIPPILSVSTKYKKTNFYEIRS